MYMNGYELSIEKTRKSEKGARIRCMYDYKKNRQSKKMQIRKYNIQGLITY